MISIKRLTEISDEAIYKAFNDAFSDYVEPFDLTIEQLIYMLERRGCDRDLSFGAFDDNELVGFTLNGIGEWKGWLTAYDTGTGVVKKYRKQGIATRIFVESLPVLREHDVNQYLLEVICTNTGAYDLYKKAGFRVSREFDYYLSPKSELNFNEHASNNDSQVNIIKDPDWDLLKSFWDFEPSWQNSIDSINRKLKHFTILGISKNNEPAGYGIIEKHTGDIPQFAVSKNFRRTRLATMLFSRLINYSDTDKIKIINTESSYEPFRKFAESINLPSGIGQYEMIREL